jgi:hypothetical protein
MTKSDAVPSLAAAIETAVARNAGVHLEAGASDRAAYFNIESRALWLGQVSEAATALADTRVPELLIESVAVSKISTEPSAAVNSISLSVRNDDSFNPADHLATHVRSSSKLATFTRLVIILAVAAITALIFTGQLPTDILTRNDVIEVASLPVVSNLVTAITPDRTSARLIVQSWRGNSDEPTPLGLAVKGPAEHAVVYIKGLMPGMELSSGNRVGSDAWEIPATGVGDVWIAPPQGFVGTAKLVAELRLPDSRIADRQAVYFEWELQRPTPVQHQLEERAALQSIPPEPIQPQTDRDEVVASQKPVIAQGQIDGKEIAVASISPAPVQLQRNRGEAGPTEILAATPRRLDPSEIGAVPAILLEPAELKSDRDETAPADSSASFLQRQLDAQEIVLLLKRGKNLIAAGDIAAARIVLRKAAEANDAEAALGLAATYDPIVLRELRVYGFMPDAAMARVWYEKATELGSLAAPRRLEMLTKETGTR